MKFTYYGHACFAVETGGKTLLFDPFIKPNELAQSVNLEKLRADYILISHGHFDHISDAVELAKRTGATVISNWEINAWLGQQGVSKGHPMNLGGSWAFDFGGVKMVNAVHSSGLPDGAYGGNPAGFVITNAEGSFYYSGDTALSLDMQLIAEEFKLRFAILSIGDNFTMGPADALRASRLLRCTDIVGVHYDTFPYIKIDHAAAQGLFEVAGVKLHLPAIGASLVF